jgi:amino acid transporter
VDTESTQVTNVRERGTGLPPVRQRSGLVRGAGPYDAFVFALATTSVGIMVSWGQFFGTGFYPGANIVLSLTIATVAALFIAWAYQYWGQVFPRSGGDYVFLTRGLNPGLGLGLNVVFVVMQPLAASFAAALAEATGWGFLGDVSTWIATTSWGFAVTGLVPVAVAGLVGIYGLKGQLRLLKWLFLAGTIGTVILVVALIFSSTPTFLAHLQQTTGLTAREIGETPKTSTWTRWWS